MSKSVDPGSRPYTVESCSSCAGTGDGSPDDPGRSALCRECDGVGLVAVAGPAGVPHTDRCPKCDGRGER